MQQWGQNAVVIKLISLSKKFYVCEYHSFIIIFIQALLDVIPSFK